MSDLRTKLQSLLISFIHKLVMSDYLPEWINFDLLKFKYNHLVTTRCSRDSTGSFIYMKKDALGHWIGHNDYGPALYLADLFSGDYVEIYLIEGRILSKETWLKHKSKLGKIIYG